MKAIKFHYHKHLGDSGYVCDKCGGTIPVIACKEEGMPFESFPTNCPGCGAVLMETVEIDAEQRKVLELVHEGFLL